jgi:BNR repeat-like domain
MKVALINWYSSTKIFMGIIGGLFLFLIISCGNNGDPGGVDPDPEIVIEGTYIVWDTATRTKITDGNYARIRQLDNQNLIAVYSRVNNLYIKYSDDLGETWVNEQLLFEGDDNYNMTNAEAIQLSNKSIIVGCNRRVKDVKWGGDYTYGIMVMISDDYGQTWTPPKLIYTAGNSSETGCWEPALLQLPNGEVQCYFANEHPYPTSNEQEISMLRSFDNGENWTSEIVTVCFAQGSRDGMPVPLLDGNNILLAIEDNSNGHLLQPSIIKETVASNWGNGIVGSSDSRRIQAVPDFAATRYAGAPYIAKLKSGEIILCYQDRDGRDKNFETMKVRVSGSVGESFTNESEPFVIPITNSAKWNSLCSLSNGKVVAVTSTNAYNQGVYLIKGEVVNN